MANGYKDIYMVCMPKNLLEISQWVSNLWGKVSRKTLLSQIPFVDDVEAELTAVNEEEEEAIEKQKKLFDNHPNDKLEEDADGEA